MTTGLAIMNVGSGSTTVSVDCYPTVGTPTIGCGASTNLSPNATVVFGALNVSDGFVGAAVVRTTNPPAPVVTLIYESGSPQQLITDAPLSGTTTAYVPELYGNYVMGQTWNSGISVQNTSSSNANVTVTYYDRLGNPVGNPQTITGLEPNRVWMLNYSGSNMPGNFSGSAVITSNSNHPIVAIVSMSHTGSGTTDTNASYTVPNR